MIALGNRLTPWFAIVGLAVSEPSTALGLDIFSDPGDGYLEVRPESPFSPTVHPSFDGSGGQGFFVNAGEWFGGITSGILPFQLPDFGPVSDPFATATLGVHLFEVGNAQETDIDLYGLSRIDSTPTLIADEYYSGESLDTAATIIQESFLKTTDEAAIPAEPNIFTDAIGDANLLTFLNAAYDSGANAGNFVFLRLSYASDFLPAGFDAYKITSRNAGGGEGDYPVLRITTNSLPGDTDNNGLIELLDFDPIRDNWLETNDSFGAVLSRTDGDLTADGMVSIEDFREWKDAFLAQGGTQAAVTMAFASLAIPEPSSALLVALSLAAAGFWRIDRCR